MTNQLEFGSRAALCRQLAKEDPANRALWMAEVEAGRACRTDTARIYAAAKARSLCPDRPTFSDVPARMCDARLIAQAASIRALSAPEHTADCL